MYSKLDKTSMKKVVYKEVVLRFLRSLLAFKRRRQREEVPQEYESYQKTASDVISMFYKREKFEQLNCLHTIFGDLR